MLNITLYKRETWTVGKAERRILEAVDMWCQKKMVGINWISKVANERVLEVVGGGGKLRSL